MISPETTADCLSMLAAEPGTLSGWHGIEPPTGYPASIEDRAREWIADADGYGRYVLIFLLAATPLLEILVVVPIGVALGLDPIAVAIVAIAGNALPVYGIVLAFDRVSSWLDEPSGDGEPSGRRRRAIRVWNRYGLPGLALLGPIVTGVHLAAAIAMSLGARPGRAIGWMTVGIVAWGVAITAASVAGVSLLT